MKITNIEIMRVAIPFQTGGPRQGLRPGLEAWTKMESLMVRVDTEDGYTGWGEAFGHFCNPGTFALLEKLVAPFFIGRDSAAIAATMEQAQRAFFGFGRNGPVMFALSAMDIALWDIAGQRANQPLYRLLGGSRNEIGLYASMVRYGGDREAIGRNAQRAEAAGFSLVKLHEASLSGFMAAREAVKPETGISLDVNCPWTLAEARAIAQAIKGRGFTWLEEPVWPPEDFSALAELRREGVRIAAGENIGTPHEFRQAFQVGALDIAQPSVVKIGGISGMREIFTLAKAFAVDVVPHCFYWGPGYLATAHLIAAMPRPVLLETGFIDLEEQPHDLFQSAKGMLTLPQDRAGLGFKPGMKVLERGMVQRATVS